jgi:hypothetical protein
MASATPFWQPAGAALVGASFGGFFALLAGRVADNRRTHSERLDKIFALAGNIVASASLIAAEVLTFGEDAAEGKASGPLINEPFRVYEWRFVQATTGLMWSLGSSELGVKREQLAKAVQLLVYGWDVHVDAHGWRPLYQAYEERHAEFVDELNTFRGLSHRDQRKALTPAPSSA